MNLYALLPLAAFIVDAILGIYILYRNSKDSFNRAYALATFSWALWALGDFLVFTSSFPATALLFNKMAVAGAALAAIFTLRFFLAFTKSKMLSKKMGYVLYVPALLFIGTEFMTDTISRSAAPSWWGYAIAYGPLYIPLTLYMIAYVLGGVLICCRSSSKAVSKKEKTRSLMLMAAVSIPLAGGIATQVIPNVLGFDIMGMATALTMAPAAIIAYAIIRYHPMVAVSVSILKKIILGFLVVTLSLTLVNYVSFDFTRQELQKSIGKNSVSLTADIIDKLNRDIYFKIEDSQQYSKGPAVQEAIIYSNREFEELPDIQGFINTKDQEWTSVPKDEISPFMQELINNQQSQELRKKIDSYEKKYGYMVYSEIFITNKYGANIAQSGKTSDYNQGDEEWWEKSRQDGLYVSDVEYDESSGVYSLTIGIRIDDENGNFLGVMKYVLNIEEVFNIIKEAKISSNYKTLEFKLLNKDGIIIFDSEENYKISENVSSEGFFREITGNRGYFLKAAERNEQDELFAYARSEGYRDFRGLNWILVTEYETEEIQKPINESIIILIVMSLAGILLAVMVGFSIYRSISRPLTRLRDATAEIASGKLDKKIEIKSNDEIGQLTSAFNQMTKNLRKSNEEIEKHTKELEQKVAERTGDISQKMGEMSDTKAAILNMMEDIDENNKNLIAMQDELKKNLKKLREVDLKKNEFISIAAHELKTPLTSIHGFSQLLLNNEVAKDPEKRSKFLKIIDTETKRLAHLVTDILDLSRIDLGTLKLVTSEVNVNDVVADVVKEMNILIKEKGLAFERDIEKNLPKIVIDRERFIEILMNLIQNSVKYTPKGKITLNIFLENKYIHFIVKDTGIGIAKQHHSKIFQRFFQVDSSYTRKSGGNGLGLSLCKEFVSMLGGNIWFRSQPNKGSEFHFTLPVKKPQGN